MDAKRRPSAAPAAAKAAPKKLSWFTLVELIVVITILAILATIGFLALSGYSQDAKDASVKANVRSVHTAIASESAVTNNSPRYYVVHDAGAALAGGTVAYVDGSPVTLSGGDWNVNGTNYSAGNPDWAKLKLNPDKFKLSYRPPMGGFLSMASLLPDSFAAYDSKSLSVGAVDAALAPSASGRQRSTSFFQVAGTAPATGLVSVSGDFPQPTAAQIALWAIAGLVKAPTGTGALVDGYSSGGSSSSTSSSSSGGGGGTCPSVPACDGTQSITFQQAQDNKSCIISNISEYIGCQINDYPWAEIPWAWVRIAWATQDSGGSPYLMVVAQLNKDQDNQPWLPWPKKLWWCNWTDIQWLANVTNLNDPDWDGMANTTAFLAGCSEENAAPKACRSIWANWYLPAKNELATIYDNKLVLNLASDWPYWSSTENGATDVWSIGHYNLTGWFTSKNGNNGGWYARCASRF